MKLEKLAFAKKDKETQVKLSLLQTIDKARCTSIKNKFLKNALTNQFKTISLVKNIKNLMEYVVNTT